MTFKLFFDIIIIEKIEKETVMKFYNETTYALKDAEIIKALEYATDSYEDGDIIVCKHTLQEILSAIKQFERDFDKGLA